jgi:hypothetical protein
VCAGVSGVPAKRDRSSFHREGKAAKGWTHSFVGRIAGVRATVRGSDLSGTKMQSIVVPAFNGHIVPVVREDLLVAADRLLEAPANSPSRQATGGGGGGTAAASAIMSLPC